jgi:hypothetical protein
MIRMCLGIISAMLLFWLSSAQAQQGDISVVNAALQSGAQRGVATSSIDPPQTQRRVTGSCPRDKPSGQLTDVAPLSA